MKELKGIYGLVMHLPLSRDLAVGKLGTHPFETGYYLYFGSALNSLEGRLRRHLRSDKKLHWQIDSLTAKTTIEAIWWAEGNARKECAWTQIALGLPGVSTPVKGFGSSDCRKCPSHLVYLPTLEKVEALGQTISTVSSEQITHSPAEITEILQQMARNSD